MVKRRFGQTRGSSFTYHSALAAETALAADQKGGSTRATAKVPASAGLALRSCGRGCGTNEPAIGAASACMRRPATLKRFGAPGEPGAALKWVTRAGAKVDRVACPWLIKRFVDEGATFLFVPAEQVEEVARREGATPFDVKGAKLGHRGDQCSFDAIVADYAISDPAVLALAKIVRAADVRSQRAIAPEGAGLELVAEGFRLTSKDDHENLSRQFHVYDALYAALQRRPPSSP